MRLIGFSAENIENLTPEEKLFLENQRDSAEMITKIEKGNGKTTILLAKIKHNEPRK